MTSELLYQGPERRASERSRNAYWQAVVDEIDYPMLLVGSSMEVRCANRSARRRLHGDHPLRIVKVDNVERLAAASAHVAIAIGAATQRGLRRLVSIDAKGRSRRFVAVVPIDSHSVLLVLGRQSVCAPLTIDWFARDRGLTSSEAQVLGLLCAGLPPVDVAERQGVALSTVRTQLGSIRAKTAANSMRDLLDMVARMPPMVGLVDPVMEE